MKAFVPPKKRSHPSVASTRARMLPTPGSKACLPTTGKTTDAKKYSARENKLTVVSSMNEALSAAEPKVLQSSRCEIKLLHGIQNVHRRAGAHRFMFERVEQKCMTLRNRLYSISDGIIQCNNLSAKALQEDGSELKMSPVNMPSQDTAWYCGRICCEGDSGAINASSVLLEGDTGKRVHIDLAHAVDFAVFPGQIVVVRGINTSGNTIIVREIWSDASLPMFKTPADKMATWNESEAFLGGLPLSVMMAAGPFTLSTDLTYKPLQDLLDHVAAQKPDVLILTGPFVDCNHRQLNPEFADCVDGFSNGNPPDSLQVVRHVMRVLIVQRLSVGSPSTTCILIPSLKDLHARMTFPQPPFDQGEVIQATMGEMDVSRSVNVQYMGNPCVVRINEILVGICTADTIGDLAGNEVSHTPGDSITRLASHVLQQRSFYPLFPPAEGCQLSMANVKYLGLEQTPDVLLLPSLVGPFAKRIGDVLCVNPGQLTDRCWPGTFARLTVHPSRKVTAGLTLSPSAPEVAHRVCERTRVDIVRI